MFSGKVLRIFLLLFTLSLLFPKNKYFISGIAINQNGITIKKARVVLIDSNGEKIKTTKTNKKGEFLLKKLVLGSYTLQAIDKNLGTGTTPIILKDKSLQVKITIPSEPNHQKESRLIDKQFDQNSLISTLSTIFS